MTNVQFPAVFSGEASPMVSDKYSFVSTKEILGYFENEGWKVRSMRQSGTRDASKKAFVTHEVRLQHGKFGQVGDSIPEIIIKNSHNGKTPLQFNMGLFRIACLNGLTVPMSQFNQTSRIRHMGIDPTEVLELTEGVSVLLPKLNERVRVMQETEIREDAAIEFLRESVKLRWDSGEHVINYDDFATAKRKEDALPTVWSVFNLAQEKLIRGEVEVTGEKRRKARPIKNFIVESQINKKLWVLAEDMLLS